jgi:hypothetical protein
MYINVGNMKCIQNLVGKPYKIPLGRPRHRWEDNNINKMDVSKTNCEYIKWTELAYDIV